MDSIREIIKKIKHKIKIYVIFPPTDVLIVIIIILVGFASFGLGRLSILGSLDKQKEVSIVTTETFSKSALVTKPTEDFPVEVVASKNGKKYHFPWCSGAVRIAEKNLITFNSIIDAKDAGYTPAINCKGLE